jgi:hypothetical protein
VTRFASKGLTLVFVAHLFVCLSFVDDNDSKASHEGGHFEEFNAMPFLALMVTL